MLALAMGVAGAQFGASPAFAAGPDEREVWDGMGTKADFMKMMMLSAADIARILDPNLANP